MIEPNLITAFKEIKPILDGLAIDYWLDSETLLWYYRNGCIRPGGKDLDLGSFQEEIFDVIDDIKDGCQQFGYDLQVNDGKITFLKPNVRITIHLYRVVQMGQILKVKLFSEKKLIELEENFIYFKKVVSPHKYRKLARLLDIFLDGLTAFSNDFSDLTPKLALLDWFKRFLIRFNKPLSRNLYYLIVEFGLKFKILKYYELYYPRMFFDYLTTYKFYREKVNIPQQTELYLEYCYGKEWKKPRENYKRNSHYQIVAKNSKGLVF